MKSAGKVGELVRPRVKRSVLPAPASLPMNKLSPCTSANNRTLEAPTQRP